MSMGSSTFKKTMVQRESKVLVEGFMKTGQIAKSPSPQRPSKIGYSPGGR